jgi:hypothetical protein
MRSACWITNATDIHSEYVIHIAFPRQQWLRERTSALRLHVHCIAPRSALCWGVTQRRMVILYRRFGTAYWSHLQVPRSAILDDWTSWPLKVGPILCPETSVKDYHSTLRNTRGLFETWKKGQIHCPETSVKDYHSTLRNTRDLLETWKRDRYTVPKRR